MDSHDFPIECAADPDGGAGALRWAAGVIALTALALALLNADAIASWTHELPASSDTAKVMAAADAWNGATARAGLDRPHVELHRTWKQAESSRWPGTR